MKRLPHIQSRVLSDVSTVSHGFFTRLGGISSGDFQSLNCSQFSGDNIDAITENRRRVLATLGGRSMTSLKQIHSNRVFVIGEAWNYEIPREGDGIVTNVPGVVLGVLGADCASVLFADPNNNVIGAAHGGWKGAVAGVTDTVVSAMCDLGADEGGIVAAIGPAIQKQSYAVGQEFVDQIMSDSDIRCDDCFGLADNGQGILFDLPKYLELKIADSGISSIDRLSDDTYSDDERFFSYRRACHLGEKNYGRQIGAICLNRN